MPNAVHKRFTLLCTRKQYWVFVFLFSMISAESAAQFTPSGDLEIHYINVGQGGSTLIIGPNGTRILYDFGWRDGKATIAPYLQDVVGLAPEDGLDYAIVSHRDSDHYTGYAGVIGAGYDVIVANYGPGSPKGPTHTMNRVWLTAAEGTTAGAVRSAPVGLRLSLGQGAEAIIMAANGRIYSDKQPVQVKNENDRSVVLFVRYGKFHYILDGDLGAGQEECTKRKTTQRDVQLPVARALLKLGLIEGSVGVDVLHVAHHGSESSTSAAYFNLMKPQVALISVGLNQRDFRHPRRAVVENVLIGPNRPDCVVAPPVQLVLQTEDGIEGDCAHCATNQGLSIGDIKITTDGETNYQIQGSNRVVGGQQEAEPGTHWVCRFDEHAALTNSGNEYCSLESISTQ